MLLRRCIRPLCYKGTDEERLFGGHIPHGVDRPPVDPADRLDAVVTGRGTVPFMSPICSKLSVENVVAAPTIHSILPIQLVFIGVSPDFGVLFRFVQ